MIKQDQSPTHHWRIAKALDCLKDAATYGAHGEGATAVIHNAPGATNRGKRWLQFSFTNHKTFANIVRDAAEPNAGPSATNKQLSMKSKDKESWTNPYLFSPKSPKLEGMELALTLHRQ